MTSLVNIASPQELLLADKILALMKIDMIDYALRREGGYLVEHSVNDHVGVGLGSLYQMYVSRIAHVTLGRDPEESNNNIVTPVMQPTQNKSAKQEKSQRQVKQVYRKKEPEKTDAKRSL